MGITIIYRLSLEFQLDQQDKEMDKWRRSMENFFHLEEDAVKEAQSWANTLKKKDAEMETSEDKRIITFTGKTGLAHRCRIVEEYLF